MTIRNKYISVSVRFESIKVLHLLPPYDDLKIINPFLKIIYMPLKWTVSDKKNLQITLEIKKHNFESQHTTFYSKKSHNFDRKMHFHEISFRGHRVLFLYIGKLP